MMEKLFRPIAILAELALLMGTVYALFAGVRFTLFDLGLKKKYDPFIRWVLGSAYINASTGNYSDTVTLTINP